MDRKPSVNIPKSLAALSVAAAIGSAISVLVVAYITVAYMSGLSAPGTSFGDALLIGYTQLAIQIVVGLLVTALPAFIFLLSQGYNRSFAARTTLTAAATISSAAWLIILLAGTYGVIVPLFFASAIAGALLFPALFYLFLKYITAAPLQLILLVLAVILLPRFAWYLSEQATMQRDKLDYINVAASQPLQATYIPRGYTYTPVTLSSNSTIRSYFDGGYSPESQAYLFAAFSAPNRVIEINQAENEPWVETFVRPPELCDINLMHDHFGPKARSLTGDGFRSGSCTKLGETSNGRAVWGMLKPGETEIIKPNFFAEIDKTVVSIEIRPISLRSFKDPYLFEKDMTSDILKIVESFEEIPHYKVKIK